MLLRISAISLSSTTIRSDFLRSPKITLFEFLLIDAWVESLFILLVFLARVHKHNLSLFFPLLFNFSTIFCHPYHSQYALIYPHWLSKFLRNKLFNLSVQIIQFFQCLGAINALHLFIPFHCFHISPQLSRVSLGSVCNFLKLVIHF